MFEKASRLKLRFNCKGICSVEDLWDLSLKQLDSIFKDLNAEFKLQSEESLLETKGEQDEILDLQISIIRHIVSVKVQEKKLRENEFERATKKEKLLKIIAEKQDAELYDRSVDELTKLVDEL